MNVYHIFTDQNDEWISDDNNNALVEVLQCIQAFIDDGHENIRVYIQEYESKDDLSDDNFTHEDCIFAMGRYPY